MLLLQKFSVLWNCESGYKIQRKMNSNVSLLSSCWQPIPTYVGSLFQPAKLPTWVGGSFGPAEAKLLLPRRVT